MVKGSQDSGRQAAVTALYTVAVMITVSGAGFIVWTLVKGIYFDIMGVNTPGAVLGALVAYLGARYLISVRKLSGKLKHEDAVFAWSNFRIGGSAKEK